MREIVERLRDYIREAGRNLETFGIEARVNAGDGNVDEWIRQTEAWRNLGATHISLNTMNAGYTTLQQHLDALRRYKQAIDE